VYIPGSFSTDRFRLACIRGTVQVSRAAERKIRCRACRRQI